MTLTCGDNVSGEAAVDDDADMIIGDGTGWLVRASDEPVWSASSSYKRR